MVTLIASLALLAPPKEPTPSIATRVFNYVGPKAARIAPKVRIVLETIVVVCDTANHLVKHTYSKPQIDIATRMTSLKAKLSVEGVDGFAVVSGTDSTWFGSTFMELKAPLTFSYTVDLAQIRPETIR